jgi:splicing factor 3A subunit 1
VKKDQKKDIKPPAPDLFSVSLPINISPLELDVIKHTAQFVAKNGQKFLVALTEREKNNAQFDFLKPNHHLFSFLTNLIDAYSKCLIPKKVRGRNL